MPSMALLYFLLLLVHVSLSDTFNPNEALFTFRSQRVSRISGGNKYEQLRVSEVWKGPPEEPGSFQFRQRWTDHSFKTKIVSELPEGFPKPGETVRGAMFGDVCISSKFVTCTFGIKYNVRDKISWFLTQLATEGRLNFWALIGDNFYDEDGTISDEFFSHLPPSVTRVPLYSLPGNHDFWTLGGIANSPQDQLGYGFTQYYMMDTEATKDKKDGEFPYDFPIEFQPHEKDLPLPSDSNFFHFSSIGAAGFIMFSGAHKLDVKEFEAACKYFSPKHPGEHAVYIFLLGHWSSENLGCQPDMYTSRLHELMSDKDGPLSEYCYPLARQNRIYFVDGHQHENKVLTPLGMRVGGQGMFDTGHFGFPVFQIIRHERNVQLLISYINIARFAYDPFLEERFWKLLSCSKNHGIIGCLDKLEFVDTWVNATAEF